MFSVIQPTHVWAGLKWPGLDYHKQLDHGKSNLQWRWLCVCTRVLCEVTIKEMICYYWSGSSIYTWNGEKRLWPSCMCLVKVEVVGQVPCELSCIEGSLESDPTSVERLTINDPLHMQSVACKTAEPCPSIMMTSWWRTWKTFTTICCVPKLLKICPLWANALPLL